MSNGLVKFKGKPLAPKQNGTDEPSEAPIIGLYDPDYETQFEQLSKGMAPRKARRMKQAFSLRLRGYEPYEIAEIVGVTTPTIRKYLKAFQSDVKDVIARIDPDDFLGTTMSRYTHMRKQLWDDYYAARNIKERTAIMKLLMSLEKEERTALQSMGALQLTPEKKQIHHTHEHDHEHEHEHHHDHQHDHEHEVSGKLEVEMTEARLDAYAAMHIADQMGFSVEDTLRMRGEHHTHLIEAPTTPHNHIEVIDAEYAEPLPMPSKEGISEENEPDFSGSPEIQALYARQKSKET